MNKNVIFMIGDYKDQVDVTELNRCVEAFGKDCRFVRIEDDSTDSTILVAGALLTDEDACAAYEEEFGVELE